MIAATLLSLLLPALVSAHGFVNKVTIDGTVYQGNSVGTTATIKSAIRQINTNSPVKGATNPDIICGPGAQPAADVANANPGSEVEFEYIGGTSIKSPVAWPHNTGPLMTYMASCNGPCTGFDPTGAKWFKIGEQGQSGSGWWQAELQSGKPINVTIPSNLAPGNYLLRSEIITLQLAMTQGGAEFYPSCIQLSVGGSQTGQPTSSEEVSFPGAYSDTDPGILTPDVYNPGFKYTFPGPPVATLGSGGSGSGSSGGSGTSGPAAPSTSNPAPSASSPPSGPSAPPSGPSAPPSGPSTPPSGPSAPPSGPSALPSGPSAPSSGPSVPASGSSAPPSGPSAPPSGPSAPPSGPSAPPAGPSAPMPSSPTNTDGNPPPSGSPSAPYPSSTGGSGSCMRQRSAPEARVVVEKKRMHRRRYRTSH